MTSAQAGYRMVGNGPPVVLIHGSMSSKRQWRALIDALKDNYTVIATDLTGYGETPFPADPDVHDLMDEVNVIRRTMASLLGEHVPAHLVAHSYGGAVALGFASRFPEEVLSLNLFEPMANHLLISFDDKQSLAQGRRLMDRIARQVARGNAMAGAETFIEYFSGEGVFSMLPEKLQHTLAGYVSKMLVDYRTTMHTPLTIEDYRRITCPVCLIAGAASTDVSLSVCRILRQQMASIRWIEVPGNHMAPITNPQDVNEAVVDWLAHASQSCRCRLPKD